MIEASGESPVSNPGPVRRADWPGLGCGIVIAAAAFAAYGRTFSVPLLLDDIPVIANNPSLRHWGTALFPPLNTPASGRPLLNLSLALNYAISGTKVWSYHAVNLLIHVLAGLALFGVVRRTLDGKNSGMDFQSMGRGEHGPVFTVLRRGKLEAHATRGHRTHATSIAFAAALLWTLHPLQTESVTYISQRAESLMGLFYLLTLYCFIRGAETPAGRSMGVPPMSVGEHGLEARATSNIRYFRLPPSYFRLFSVLFCLLGMATKEVMVTAPVLVLLYDRAFLSGSFREALSKRVVYYLGLGSTWLLLAFLIVSSRLADRGIGFDAGVGSLSYALTELRAVVTYAKLAVWPHPLVFDYGPELPVAPPLRAWLPFAVLVAAGLGATAAAWRRSRPLGFLGAAFFLLLAPSSSIVPVTLQPMAESRMYLPLAAVVILVVLAGHAAAGRKGLFVLLALAVGLGALAARRNGDYRSSLSIWSDTVAKRPGSSRAHNNLGYVLEGMPGRLNDAIVQCEEALRLKPDYADAHNNLGYALAEMPGRSNDAIAQYEAAARLKPDDAVVQYNLGNALSGDGRIREAIERYEAAIRLRPDYAEAHNNLGNALNAAGGTAPAIAQLEEALRLKPDYVDAHFNLGNAFNAAGRIPEAIAQYEDVLRLTPDDPATHVNLAIALLQANPVRAAEAVAHLETALRLQPGNETATQLLARIRAPQP